MIDCLLGQISQSSVDLGLNSGMRLITFPDNKLADMSRQDHMTATDGAVEEFTLNELTRLILPRRPALSLEDRGPGVIAVNPGSILGSTTGLPPRE